jgi:hypothetical protein
MKKAEIRECSCCVESITVNTIITYGATIENTSVAGNRVSNPINIDMIEQSLFRRVI